VSRGSLGRDSEAEPHERLACPLAL